MALRKPAHDVFQWRNLYFVLGSLLGLGLTVLGAAIFLNTLLNQYVFTSPSWNRSIPPTPYVIEVDKFPQDLTAEQESALDRWVVDYENWQENEKNIDYEQQSRQNTRAIAASLMLVGIPVLLVHLPFVVKRS